MINKKIAILVVVSIMLFYEVSDFIFKRNDLSEEYDSKIVLIRLTTSKRRKS